MKPYGVYIRIEAVEVLKAMHRAQRARIARFINLLADDPFRQGDYAERDEADRTIQIKIVGHYAVIYWSDHAVDEVRIVDIVRADRR